MNFKLSTLYVGDLHPEVTEAMLVGKFSPSGHLHSVRVCKNWDTGASLGYAYVNFYQQADAERALETLNCVLLMGKPMRVMWCQRDATLRKSGVGNLFIRNLDLETDESTALFDLFSVFGKVLSCKIVAYKTGTKGYGYVQFESQDAANLAKERLDGKLFNNHIISVEHFKSRKDRDAEINRQNEQKEILDLYIKNLDEHINNDYLHREFSQFGTVTEAKVIMENGRSRGFGFVRFSSAEEAAEARSQLNGKIWGRKPIFIGVAQHKEERQREKPPPPQFPDVEQSQAQHYGPLVEQSPAPPYVPVVEQSLAPIYGQVVKQSPAPPYVPAIEQSLAPPQVPSYEQCLAPLLVPAVERCLAPPYFPAVEQCLAPRLVAAVEQCLAPPQVPAVEQSPAAPQVPAVEQSLAPSQVPAVAQSPAPSQVPADEQSPAPPDDHSVKEKPPPEAKDLDEVPIISEVPTDASPQPRFTIYMLESNTNFEEQFQMAHDHLLPLVEKIHPSDPKKSTWMLVKSEKN